MSFLSQNPKVIGMKISDGDAGIRQTVFQMRKEMNLARQDPNIQNLVSRLTSSLPTQTEKSKAIVAWFMENIRYATDDQVSMTEKGLQFINFHECSAVYAHCEPVEILYKPEFLLRNKFGDCDDFSMALGVMHELAGISVKIKIIAADATQPREFSHVYILASLDGKWTPIDAVNRAEPWGWEHPKPFRSEVVI